MTRGTTQAVDQGVGATGELRPTAKVVRNNEAFVLQNIKWNDQLEQGLVNYGLLEGNSGEPVRLDTTYLLLTFSINNIQ